MTRRNITSILPAALMAGGCTGSLRQPSPKAPPATSAPEVRRRVEIYAVVIQALVGRRPEGSSKPIWVISETYRQTIDLRKPKGFISGPVRTGVIEALQDLPISFVGSREAAFDGDGNLRGDGTIVALSPIPVGNAIEVSGSRYDNIWSAGGSTFLLELRTEGWEITGTSSSWTT